MGINRGEDESLMYSHRVSRRYKSIATMATDPLGKQKRTQGSQLPEVVDEDRGSPNESGLRNRMLVTLIVASMVGLVAGSLYGFGRYSKDLRDTLSISQMAVQRFGILLDTGNYIGHPLTGWIYDHFGPRKSCLLAALIVFCSYGSIHLGLSSAPIWTIDIGFFGVGLGSGLGYIAGLGSTTNAFTGTPHIGRAVGTVAAGYGFSSTLVGVAYHQAGLSFFFLFWAFLFAAITLLGAFVFQPKHSTMINAQNRDERQEPVVDDADACLRLSEHSGTNLSNSTDEDSDKNEAGGWKSWKRLDFWLLFGSFACITGCGLMIINNISTMVQSIGGSDSFAGYLVFGLSICNVLGRVLMGALTDHPKLHKIDLYRYASLVMALALIISALATTSSVCLAITVALAAIAYGGSWVLMIGILADLFGKDDFGKDYGLIAMGPAVSGMIFNSLSAKLYESHADFDTGICIGAACYRNIFFMAAASATVGYLILLWFMPARRPTEEDSMRYDEVIQDTI